MHILKCDTMKKYIEYFYDVELQKIINVGDNYFFNINGINYCLYEVKGEINRVNIETILRLTSFMYEFHNVILTKDNQIFCVVEGKKYSLLKINLKSNRIINLNDLLRFKNYTINMSKKAYTPNWIDLWSRKIDYLEYYINNKDNLKSEIKGILYYFIGLGENAIKYIKDSLKTSGFNQNKIVLSHYRVDSDSTLYSLYNPFNLMLDYSVRDIAEYIKSMFYSDKIDYIEIENLVNKNILSEMEYKLLFGRLLFPTFFFDMFDKYEDNKLDNKQLISIYNKTTEYEVFLHNVYLIIKKRNNIISVPWLNK